MAAKDSDQHDWSPESQCALAYIFSLCASRGLTFRFLSGADYGIDQLIESSRTTAVGPQTKGHVAVQVKSINSLPRDVQSLKNADRDHLNYWRWVGSPFIYCLVGVAKSNDKLTATGALWFNVWELDQQSLLKPGYITLSKRFSRLELMPSPPVKRTSALSEMKEADVDNWKMWVESATAGPEIAGISRTLKAVDHLQESGQAKLASQELAKLTIRFNPATSPTIKCDVLIAYAKALRRSGDLLVLKPQLLEVSDLLGKIGELGWGRRFRLFRYESAFVELLEGLSATSRFERKSKFHVSASCFKESGFTDPESPDEKRETLIAESGRLLANALMCYEGNCREDHVESEINLMVTLLDWWEKRGPGELSEERIDYYRRRYNGELSVIRWLIAHRVKGEASERLKNLKAELGSPEGHHTLHSLAHFQLVRAWLAVVEESKSLGDLLKSYDLVFKACIPDLELESYYKLFSGRQLVVVK